MCQSLFPQIIILSPKDFAPLASPHLHLTKNMRGTSCSMAEPGRGSSVSALAAHTHEGCTGPLFAGNQVLVPARVQPASLQSAPECLSPAVPRTQALHPPHLYDLSTAGLELGVGLQLPRTHPGAVYDNIHPLGKYLTRDRRGAVSSNAATGRVAPTPEPRQGLGPTGW